jgi:hypothetical protein
MYKDGGKAAVRLAVMMGKNGSRCWTCVERGGEMKKKKSRLAAGNLDQKS